MKNPEEPSVRKGVNFASPRSSLDLHSSSPGAAASPDAPTRASFRRDTVGLDVSRGNTDTSRANTGTSHVAWASSVGNISGASALSRQYHPSEYDADCDDGDEYPTGGVEGLDWAECTEYDTWSDADDGATSRTVTGAPVSRTVTGASTAGATTGGGRSGRAKRLKGHVGTWSTRVLSALRLMPDRRGRLHLPSMVVFTRPRPPLAHRTENDTWWTKIKGWAIAASAVHRLNTAVGAATAAAGSTVHGPGNDTRGPGHDRDPATVSSSPERQTFKDDTAHGGRLPPEVGPSGCSNTASVGTDRIGALAPTPSAGFRLVAARALDTGAHTSGLGLGPGAYPGAGAPHLAMFPYPELDPDSSHRTVSTMTPDASLRGGLRGSAASVIACDDGSVHRGAILLYDGSQHQLQVALAYAQHSSRSSANGTIPGAPLYSSSASAKPCSGGAAAAAAAMVSPFCGGGVSGSSRRAVTAASESDWAGGGGKGRGNSGGSARGARGGGRSGGRSEDGDEEGISSGEDELVYVSHDDSFDLNTAGGNGVGGSIATGGANLSARGSDVGGDAARGSGSGDDAWRAGSRCLPQHPHQQQQQQPSQTDAAAAGATGARVSLDASTGSVRSGRMLLQQQPQRPGSPAALTSAPLVSLDASSGSAQPGRIPAQQPQQLQLGPATGAGPGLDAGSGSGPACAASGSRKLVHVHLSSPFAAVAAAAVDPTPAAPPNAAAGPSHATPAAAAGAGNTGWGGSSAAPVAAGAAGLGSWRRSSAAVLPLVINADGSIRTAGPGPRSPIAGPYPSHGSSHVSGPAAQPRSGLARAMTDNTAILGLGLGLGSGASAGAAGAAGAALGGRPGSSRGGAWRAGAGGGAAALPLRASTVADLRGLADIDTDPAAATAAAMAASGVAAGLERSAAERPPGRAGPRPLVAPRMLRTPSQDVRGMAAASGHTPRAATALLPAPPPPPPPLLHSNDSIPAPSAAAAAGGVAVAPAASSSPRPLSARRARGGGGGAGGAGGGPVAEELEFGQRLPPGFVRTSGM